MPISRRTLLYSGLAGAVSLLSHNKNAFAQETTADDLRLLAMRNALIRANIKSVYDRTIGVNGFTEKGLESYRDEIRKQFIILSDLHDANSTAEFIDDLVYNASDLNKGFVDGVLGIVGYKSVEDLVKEDSLNDTYVDIGTVAVEGGLGYAAYAGAISAPWAITGVALAGLLGLTTKSINDPSPEILMNGEVLTSLHRASLNAMKGNLRNNIVVLYGFLRQNHPDIADQFAVGLQDGLSGKSLKELHGYLNGVEIALDSVAQKRQDGVVNNDSDLRKEVSGELSNELDKSIIEYSQSNDAFVRRELESAALLAAGILEFIFRKPGIQKAVTNLLNAVKHVQKLTEISKAMAAAQKAGAVAQAGQAVGVMTMAAATFQVWLAAIALVMLFVQLLTPQGEKPEITYLRAIYEFLQTFREEMHARFDVVEARLGAIERKIDELIEFLALSVDEILINREQFERSLASQTSLFLRVDYQRFRDISELNRAEERATLLRLRNSLANGIEVDPKEVETAVYSLYQKAITEAMAATSRGPIPLVRGESLKLALTYFEDGSVPISQKCSILESEEMHFGSLEDGAKVANPLILSERLVEVCAYIVEFGEQGANGSLESLLTQVEEYITNQADLVSRALALDNLRASIDKWASNERRLVTVQFGKRYSGDGTRTFQPADNVVGWYQEWFFKEMIVGQAGNGGDSEAINEVFSAVAGASEYSRNYPSARLSENKLAFLQYEYGNNESEFSWSWRRFPKYVPSKVFTNLDIVTAANGLVEETSQRHQYHPNVPMFSGHLNDSVRSEYRAIISRSSSAYDAEVASNGFPPRNPDVSDTSIYSIASIYGVHGVYALGGDSKAYYDTRRRVANILARKIVYAPIDPIRAAIAYGVLKVEWIRNFDCRDDECLTGYSKKRFRLRNKNDNSVIIVDFGELVFPGERRRRVLIRSIHTSESPESRGERLGVPEGKEAEAFDALYQQVKSERIRLLFDQKYERSMPWFIEKVMQGVIDPVFLASYDIGGESSIRESRESALAGLLDSQLYSETIASSLAMRHLFQADSLEGSEAFLREYRRFLNPKKTSDFHIDTARKVKLLEESSAPLIHDFLFSKIDESTKELEENHIPDDEYTSESYRNLAAYVSGVKYLIFES